MRGTRSSGAKVRRDPAETFAQTGVKLTTIVPSSCRARGTHRSVGSHAGTIIPIVVRPARDTSSSIIDVACHHGTGHYPWTYSPPDISLRISPPLPPTISCSILYGVEHFSRPLQARSQPSDNGVVFLRFWTFSEFENWSCHWLPR